MLNKIKKTNVGIFLAWGAVFLLLLFVFILLGTRNTAAHAPVTHGDDQACHVFESGNNFCSYDFLSPYFGNYTWSAQHIVSSESQCSPTAVNSSSQTTGLFQINPSTRCGSTRTCNNYTGQGTNSVELSPDIPTCQTQLKYPHINAIVACSIFNNADHQWCPNLFSNGDCAHWSSARPARCNFVGTVAQKVGEDSDGGGTRVEICETNCERPFSIDDLEECKNQCVETYRGECYIGDTCGEGTVCSDITPDGGVCRTAPSSQTSPLEQCIAGCSGSSKCIDKCVDLFDDDEGGTITYTPPSQFDPVSGEPIVLGPVKCNVNWPRIPIPGGEFDLNDYCKPGATITIGAIVSAIFAASLWLGGIIAFISLIYAGFLYIFSGSAPANRSKARNQLQNVAWGMAILLLSWVTLNLINPDITDLKFATQEIVRVCQEPGETNCIPVYSLPGEVVYTPNTNQYQCAWDGSECVTDASNCESGFGGVPPEDPNSCESSGATSAQECNTLTQDALAHGALQCIVGGYNPQEEEEEEEEIAIAGEFYCAPRNGGTGSNLECTYDSGLNNSGFDKWPGDTSNHCNPGYKVPNNAGGKCLDETSNNGTRGEACWSISFPCVPE